MTSEPPDLLQATRKLWHCWLVDLSRFLDGTMRSAVFLGWMRWSFKTATEAQKIRTWSFDLLARREFESSLRSTRDSR